MKFSRSIRPPPPPTATTIRLRNGSSTRQYEKHRRRPCLRNDCRFFVAILVVSLGSLPLLWNVHQLVRDDVPDEEPSSGTVAVFDPLSGREGGVIIISNEDMLTFVQRRLAESVNRTDDDVWNGYVSHWGFFTTAALSDWQDRHHGWYHGDQPLLPEKNRPITSNNETAMFRCVTKLLVAILFLRLEELGLADLDALIYTEQHGAAEAMNRNITWRHVFTNTAGSDRNQPGQVFEYQNGLWEYAPSYVQKVCGLSFTNAMQHHVLDPMGLVGSFDLQQTPSLLPLAARGFVGSLDDLLLIGSTLASRGVSPKTRKQVLSVASTKRILQNTVLEYDPAKAFFYDDKVVKSMQRYRNPRHSREENNTVMPANVVEGYGLGLWCVHGWRQTLQGHPIRGWLSMGSSEAVVYFDETGFVLAMLSPTRRMGYELTTAFANVVRDVGDHILQTAISMM